jgi:DNA-binding response OmpR family regulator
MNCEPDWAPTILIIDDSIETLQVVRFALVQGGYRVITALSGEEALEVMRQQGLPHLIIVDLNMPPGMDGFEFARIVGRWSDIPVVVLTAMDEADTVVEGLRMYAEDYLIKPFMPAELIARVRRILQRIGVFPFEPAMPLVVDDHLSIDFPDRTLDFRGRTLNLTPTEAKLIYLLLRSPDETVSYDYLLRRMWPRELVFEDRLHVFVHRLRNKLARHQIDHPYLVLDRGVGYRFARLVEEMAAI